MPITQSRMIALVNAGRDYKQAYESTRAAIETHFTAANNSEEDWAVALHRVWEHTKPSIVVQNLNSAAILEVEHSYFHHFRKRNDNAAARALRKRRKLLVDVMSQPEAEPTKRLPQTTAPKHTIRPEEPNYKREPLPTLPNTDGEQIQSDSSLDFNLAEAAEPETADVINKFLQEQEERERDSKLKGDKP